MLNPIKWPADRYAVLSTAIIVGVTEGTVFGFMHSGRVYSINEWLSRYSEDALTWAITGAVIVGGTIYARLVSK